VAVTTALPPAPSDDKRWRIVETRMRRLGQRPDALIEVLHAAQEAFGYLDTPGPRRSLVMSGW
jgi:bidirectional [NiFe] hydrogenase diaphorase subunit